MPCFGISRLQISTASATAVIIGFIGGHVDEIFFTDNRFDHKPEVVSHRIPKGLSHQLAWILDRKLDFEVLVPVGIYLESSFPDPFGIKLNNTDDFKIVLYVEFFQSGPDCE